jgi:hypothetical protein
LFGESEGYQQFNAADAIGIARDIEHERRDKKGNDSSIFLFMRFFLVSFC